MASDIKQLTAVAVYLQMIELPSLTDHGDKPISSLINSIFDRSRIMMKKKAHVSGLP
jgi:hypothetical protein